METKVKSSLVKGRDKNIQFFNKMANGHRSYNNIDQLMIHGAITQDPHRIQNEIVDYYKSSYTEINQWRPICQNLQLPILTEEGKML